MGGYRRGGIHARGALRDVYVARTVKEPDKTLERFLKKLGRHLGSRAVIYSIGSTHFTFLESKGVKDKFRNFGYTPADIRTFRGDLDAHLNDTVSTDDMVVEIDTAAPLRWIAGNILALNVAPSPALSATREQSEIFLKKRFGEVPDLRDFEEHIAIGEVSRRAFPESANDPLELLPNGLVVPRTAALNGLEVYLGKFQQRTPAQ